jgi:hypothetical protein
MSSKMLRALLLAMVVFALGGCAGAQIMKEKPTPQATADKGMVYFFRESHFAGAAVVFDVKDGADTIGILQSGTYFWYAAAPGPHTFTAKTEATSAVTLNVEAGKTYYVGGGVSLGAFVGHPKLTVANEADWQKLFPDLHYAVKQATPQ